MKSTLLSASHLQIETDRVLKLFDEAIRLDALSPGDNSDDVAAARAEKASMQAFDSAKSLCGWDWEAVSRGGFATWCLKATPAEILAEGRKKFARAMARRIRRARAA